MDAAALQDQHVCGPGATFDLANQTSFADARLAGDQQDYGLSAACLGERVFKATELVVAPHEDRTPDPVTHAFCILSR